MGRATLSLSRNPSHIAERFFLHVASSGSVWLLAAWLLEQLGRAAPAWAVPAGAWALALPVALSFAVISLREVYDVARGNWHWKSVIDWASWLLGLSLSAWLAWSLAPSLAAARAAMEAAR